MDIGGQGVVVHRVYGCASVCWRAYMGAREHACIRPMISPCLPLSTPVLLRILMSKKCLCIEIKRVFYLG